MPAPYNGPYVGLQSPLEKYAIDSRNYLLPKTSLFYKTPFSDKNQYGLTQTNAISDLATPYRGKGTNDTFDLNNTYNGYKARNNYAGGDNYDIKGSTVSSLGGVSIQGNGWGRNKAILYNITTFGYGVNVDAPTDTKTWYKAPNTGNNIGQVII